MTGQFECIIFNSVIMTETIRTNWYRDQRANCAALASTDTPFLHLRKKQ